MKGLQCQSCSCIIYTEKCPVCGYTGKKEYDFIFEVLNEPKSENLKGDDVK